MDRAGTAPIDPHLTPREAEVLCLLGKGYRSYEIARKLSLACGTIDHVLAEIRDKYRITGRTSVLRRMAIATYIEEEVSRRVRESQL